MAKKKLIVLLYTAILLSVIIERVSTELTQEKQALVAFLSAVPHANRIQWNETDSPCNWVGIECDAARTFVATLRLPGVGLVGRIPANTLGNLINLRVLSLRSNRLSGDLPADFSNLTMLRSLYLQNNLFSGSFPASLVKMNRLVRLDLSSNNFSGEIPFAVNDLTLLTGLLLENNQFSGNIPSINPSNLVDFNVSNNKLNGSIPNVLTKFPASSFAGNLDLCGGPLTPCNPSFFPSPSPPPGEIAPLTPVRKKSRKLSKAAIIAIAVGSSFILLLLLLVLVLCLCKKRKRQSSPKPPKPVAAASRGTAVVHETGTTSSSKEDITGTEKERNKLVFLEAGIYSFDLEDLLRASAEVLGKGSVGTTYKAVLEEGTTVVVKRLKDVAVSKREFDLQMEILGKIKHDNIVALRAYYFSKDEKLLVSDFMASGSLSSLLHGSRGSGRTPLDWDNRMKIATSVAKGISHLHQSNVPHGNIKSSNVLLRPDHDVGISDYGLNPLFGSAAPPNRVAGYRAPEVVETRRVTLKSDVYSYGVLLLELLTGKAPSQASLGDEGIDLPRWVQSVVREEWTAEVFDAELMRYHNIEEEMVQLLQIAMSCVSIVPDQRPTMPEVVRLIGDMNRSETEDGLRQSSDDPSRGSDGHTPPTEVRTSPRTTTP